MRTFYPKLKFIPQTSNFSELDKNQDEQDDLQFDPMDQVQQVRNETEDKLDYEILIMQVMNNLNDREKIVFLFQLMRDDGYRIDHYSCSKVIHVTLRTYMNFLKRVRLKTAVIFKNQVNLNK